MFAAWFLSRPPSLVAGPVSPSARNHVQEGGVDQGNESASSTACTTGSKGRKLF